MFNQNIVKFKPPYFNFHFFSRDSFVLSDDQTKWVNIAREKILQLIRETPPNGVQVMDHLL